MWLKSGQTDIITKNMTPKGFRLVDKARTGRKGGVANDVETDLQKIPNMTSCEVLELLVMSKLTCSVLLSCTDPLQAARQETSPKKPYEPSLKNFTIRLTVE